VINSNWHLISYRFGGIAAYCLNFGHFAFRATLCVFRDNVRCSSWAHWKARSALPISVNWTFFVRCYGWRSTSENRSKVGDFAPTRPLWLKISGRRGRPPPIIFARLVRLMNALQLYRWQFSQGCYSWGATSKIDRKSAISLQHGHFYPTFQVQVVAPTNNFCTPSYDNECLTTLPWQFWHKELCSRPSSSEVRFWTEIGRVAFFEPPLWGLGVSTMIILGTLESA